MNTAHAVIKDFGALSWVNDLHEKSGENVEGSGVTLELKVL